MTYNLCIRRGHTVLGLEVTVIISEIDTLHSPIQCIVLVT